MIGVFGELGEWERALKIFKEIKEDERDSISYTTILGTLEKCSRVTESLEIFYEMISFSIKIMEKKNMMKSDSNFLITDMILEKKNNEISNSNQKNDNNSNKENEIDSNIIPLGPRPLIPTIQMITSVISVLGKNGEWQQAYSIFTDMQSLSLSSLLPSTSFSSHLDTSNNFPSMNDDQNIEILNMINLNSTKKNLNILPPIYPDKVLIFTMIRILEKSSQLDKAALVKQKYSLKLPTSALPSSLLSPPISASTSTSTSTSPTQKFSSSPSSSSSSSFSVTPNFGDLIREGKRCGDFRPAVAAADAWLALDR